MLAAYLSALVCAFSRGGLNVLDRAYFRKESSNFVAGLFFNASYPLTIVLVIGFLQGISVYKVIDLIKVPAVFMAALGAQLAAVVFSYAFKKMSVRSIVFSAKFSDLLIPLVLLPITLNFDARFYLFSSATSLLFVPFVLAMRRSNEVYDLKIISMIIITTSIQAFINAAFSLTQLTIGWSDFLAVFMAISFYRLVLTSLISIFVKGSIFNRNSYSLSEHFFLFFRAFIACASQAAFFYSLTRANGNHMWPILNIAPFAASVMASGFLKEKFGRLEITTSLGFLSLLVAYLFLTR